MSAVLRMEVTLPTRSAAELASRVPGSGAQSAFFSWLAALVGGLASGFGARVRLGIDESTPKAATGVVAFTQSNLTAGDAVIINSIRYVAVSGAAVAASGQFSIDTSSTAVGDSFVLALAAFPDRDRICSGSNAAGTVTVTALVAGTGGNGIVMQEKDAAGGIALTQFSGGRDAGSLTSITGTFTGLPTANDTLTIGGVVLTAKASPANENEFAIGASAAAAATNLIGAINAHTKLKGLVVASSGGSGIVVMQLQFAGRTGNLVSCTELLGNYTQTATSFAPAGTEAWASTPITVALGPATASSQ